MDPITGAIVAALSAGAGAGMNDSAKKAIGDAYEGLKALLKKKFAGHGEVLNALENLEAKSNSEGRKQVLAEELKVVNADKEPELMSGAQALLRLVEALPSGERHTQVAIGVGNIQAHRGATVISQITGSQDKQSSE